MNKREALAEYAHEAWAGWMKYMYRNSTRVGDVVILGPVLAKQWDRQMNTPYKDLSEYEKNSDRVEADRMLAIMSEGAIDD